MVLVAAHRQQVHVWTVLKMQPVKQIELYCHWIYEPRHVISNIVAF